MAYRRLDPTPFLDVASPPWPLGASGAWLPVTHVQARLTPSNQWWRASASHLARERGLWLYYAAGCSDLYYQSGTTLAARNRADAALRVAARCDLGGKGGGPSGGAAHVASFLNATSFSRGGNALGKQRYLDALGSGDVRLRRLVAVLREAARWPFFQRQHGGGDLRRGGGNSSNNSSISNNSNSILGNRSSGTNNQTAAVCSGLHGRQLRRCQRRHAATVEAAEAAEAAAMMAFEGAAPFCEPTFLRLQGKRGEGSRAECAGQCALLELGAALVLFDFLDECAPRMHARCERPRTQPHLHLVTHTSHRVTHRRPHLTALPPPPQTCSSMARAAASTRCSC